MASRITIYGTNGEKDTERLRREMKILSMTYNFEDVKKNPGAVRHLVDLGEEPAAFPKIEIQLDETPGSVILTNPDAATLRRSLFSEAVFGITSYWI
jgi:hypothetical protein